MDDTDTKLLARYASHHAEDAFAEIVRRHLGLVHSAALRQVRAPQLAEEVAQSTFIKLARHAGQLAPDTILPAWLYQVTRREAIDVVRREASRHLREQSATEMNAMNATAADWTHIEPLLDEAMHALDDTDRAAVLLRYFENKSLREVGVTLGTTDNAAQKRLSRAVKRLREFFAKRGVTTGASGLVVVISANAVQAAPIGLAVTVSTAAVLAGTTMTTTATATATKAIAMATTQKALIAVALAAAVGTGIYEAHQASNLRTQVQTLQQQTPLTEQIAQLTRERDEAAGQLAALPPVPPSQIPAKQNIPPAPAHTAALPAATNPSPAPPGIRVTWPVNPQALAQQPPGVIIRPSELAHPGGPGTGMSSSTSGTLATGSTLKEIVAYAYNVPPAMRNRILMPADAPDGYFDFMDTLPQGGREALQQVLKEQYGLVARREIRAVETLSVMIANTGAPGLRANTSGDVGGGGSIGNGKVRGKNATMADITSTLESMVGTPVIDQTGATDRFDYELSFKPGASVEEIKQAALDQLGLALVPSPDKLPVEFLTVEKADKTSINNKEQ